MVAHESVLQFAPYRCWHELLIITEDPAEDELKACIHRLCASMPALGLVLQSGLESRSSDEGEAYESALAVLKWVRKHCLTAWGEVHRYKAEEPDPEPFKDADWRKVRSHCTLRCEG